MADIVSLKESRVPLFPYLEEMTPSEREPFALAALPHYSRVGADDAEAFRMSLRDAIMSTDYDRLLSIVRNAFTEFCYDDFPQLEGYYQDLLAIVTAILGEKIVKYFYGPGVVEWLIDSHDKLLNVTFNLRGTAEEAASKSKLADAGAISVGVSFSAFDRTIDRWLRLN